MKNPQLNHTQGLKTESFSSKIRNKKRMLGFTISIQHFNGNPRQINREKEIKCIQVDFCSPTTQFYM